MKRTKRTTQATSSPTDGPEREPALFIEAAERFLRHPLATVMRRAIRTRRLTQSDAAALMGLAQPDVSTIVRGRVRGFSVDRLLLALAALGHDVDIVIHVTDEHVAGTVSVHYDDKRVPAGKASRRA